MANRYVAMVVGAVLAAGSVGTGVYVANTQLDARVAIAAAHDVTTRHGELAVRVDAGGADVTALAPVDPGTTGQILTVGDAGIPVWRTLSTGDSYPVTMLAGVEGDWSGLGSSPASATATIASSLVTIDTPAGTSCDVLSGGCSTDAVRAVRSIPYYAPESWSLRARLVSVSSYGLYVTMFGVATGTTWSTSVAKYVVYIVGDADNVVIARYGASGSTHGSASVAGIRSGEGWVRFDALGRTLTVYAAVGVAGAEPTSWGSPIGTVTMTATDPQPQRVVVFSTGSTGGSARSAVWDSVRLQAVE